MEIETLKENKEENSPMLGIYEVNLKVSDGIRFGTGKSCKVVIA